MIERYVVKPGDSLWAVSQAKLGGGMQWPRLWRYNNRPAIIAVTGKGIPNPDLIYPGQTLLVPSLPHVKAHPHGGVASGSAAAVKLAPTGSGQPLRTSPGSTAAPSGPLSHSLPDIQSPISIKFRLDDLRFPPIVQPGVIMEIRMTGDVVLMTKKSYPAVYVTSRKEIEAQVTTQANQAFGTLVNDQRLIYDTSENRLTYRSMMVIGSRTPNVPSSAVGVQMDSTSPIPKLRFEFRFPKLEGSLPVFNYVALDVKLVVELTPTPQPGGPSPSPQPLREPSTNWNRVIGTGLLVTAGVIVVGTLVEDFFTAGAGTLDDPASFAAAGASVARGLQLVRGATVVLQAASIPARIAISVALVPAIASTGQIQK